MHSYWRFVKEHGIYLKDKIGTLDWALTRADALTALSILKEIQVTVLGVDVLLEKNNKFYYIFEDQVIGSWSCGQPENELFEDFLRRSLSETKEYIKRYPEQADGNYYYVLSPGHAAPKVEETERRELNNLLLGWKYLGTEGGGNYEWLVDPILSSLHFGHDDFLKLKELIEKQIKTYFRIPVIYNMDVDSNIKEILEWYKGFPLLSDEWTER